ncbi:hypothetical protein ACRAWD_26330, partial [Caulobacter segnis]
MGFLTKTKLGWTFAFGVLILLCFILQHKPAAARDRLEPQLFLQRRLDPGSSTTPCTGGVPAALAVRGQQRAWAPPSFYYYPPLPFYVTAAVVAAFSANKNDCAQIAAWGSFYTDAGLRPVDVRVAAASGGRHPRPGGGDRIRAHALP